MARENRDNIQRTLILLKPDALHRQVCGEIITRIERAGLKIVGWKMVHSDKERALKHYTEDITERRGQHVRDVLVDMLLSSPVVAMCVEGISAMEIMRKLCGATQPLEAASGTIRGDYSHVSYKHADANDLVIYNLIHASTSLEEAESEINVWFTKDELFDYETVHERFTQ